MILWFSWAVLDWPCLTRVCWCSRMAMDSWQADLELKDLIQLSICLAVLWVSVNLKRPTVNLVSAPMVSHAIPGYPRAGNTGVLRFQVQNKRENPTFYTSVILLPKQITGLSPESIKLRFYLLLRNIAKVCFQGLCESQTSWPFWLDSNTHGRHTCGLVCERINWGRQNHPAHGWNHPMCWYSGVNKERKAGIPVKCQPSPLSAS